MSVIEAVTVTLYRVRPDLRPEGWRKGKPRRQKALAYRDAAWAKLRKRCRCVHADAPDALSAICRYHDKQYKCPPNTSPYDVYGDPTSGPSQPHAFEPPRSWHLPRSDEEGYWDYGRAVAFRLARFYAYLDARVLTPEVR